MNLMLVLCLMLMFASISIAAAPTTQTVPEVDRILETLKRPHPRLIVSQADFDRIRNKHAYTLDASFHERAKRILTYADKTLDEPAVRYEIPDGKRLLAVSRRVRDRVEFLAVAYHLTHDKKYVDRLWLDLDAARQFKDWNPSHFLDTAEMTFAFGNAYDWLYSQWTDDQRKKIREAIVAHGLKVGLEAYSADKPAWWTKSEHNWNQVCNGGLMVGALAIADEEPELAARIIHEAVTKMPLAIRHYAPDGAWNEGPGYWNYATRYTARPIAALKTALGTDFGLSDVPGLSKAGLYAAHIVGPSGLAFNYADGGSSWGGAPELWWFAKRYDQPLLKSVQEHYAKTNTKPLDLLWGDPTSPDAIPANTPADAYFRVTEIATLRTAWNDPNALFVGLKAGDNKANHSNLDLGSFVLDAKGQRFIVDLGPDDYNLPGYFGKLRWTYYRLRAEGHNTLVIGQPSDAPDQDPKANVPITQFDSTANRAIAITDLSNAYVGASRVWRGVWLDKQAMTVLVQDEIETQRSPQPVWWFAHTPAEITLSDDGRTATLALKGESIRARLIEPAGAAFAVHNASPLAGAPNPERQNANKGIRKLAIELKDVTQTRIAVLFEADNTSNTKLIPLSDWK